MFDHLANPARFMRFAAVAEPAAWCVFGAGLAAGLYASLIGSPPDYQQGETVRIMYVHVPAAWMALGGYLAMAVAAFFHLAWRHPLADIGARAMALPGCGFALVCLVTGSFWGKPMWGTWWAWDARLTSMLILLFLYVGYIALANGFDRLERGSRPGAILLLVGVVNLPVIKFSVDWWNTLHQGASLLRPGGPSIDPSMLAPLLLMAVASMAWFVAVTLVRMRAMLCERRIQALLMARGVQGGVDA